MNPPTVKFCSREQRKLGDSNPRYGYPYGSLANCWFQPLTQPSSRILNRINQASFLNASAKVLLFSDSTKSFCNFFSIKMHFLCNSHIIRGCFLSVWWVLSFLKRAEADFLSQKSASCKRKGRSMMWWNSECINIWESSAFVIHRLFSLPACCSLCGPPWARECPLGFNSVIWWVSRSNRNDPYSFWHPCIITMQWCKHLSHYLIMQR